MPARNRQKEKNGPSAIRALGRVSKTGIDLRSDLKIEHN
jgi:hypothetical protein